MCLAVPALVTEMLDGATARVEVSGASRIVSLALVEGVRPGDYVILHVGYALSRLDPAEAERTLGLFAELGQAGGRA